MPENQMQQSRELFNQSGLKVLSAGVNSHLQDIGRKGYLFSGVSQSGFLDAKAAFIANRLCGNPVAMPLVEIPWGGFKFVAQVNNIIAVCGARVKVTINDKPYECWCSHQIHIGDEVSISPPAQGVWSYLAIRGGFQVQPVLGSVAGNQREKLGGLEGNGEAIKKGDILPCRDSQHSRCLSFSLAKFALSGDSEIRLRVIPGAQYKQLSRIQKRAIFATRFQLGKDYNRMGYRLNCSNAVLKELPKITPDAIAFGAVQIPPSGQPIILLNDRQTLGGYCKIGSVISPDCHRLVQCRPGCTVRFEIIRPTQAQPLIKHYWSELQSYPLEELSS